MITFTYEVLEERISMLNDWFNCCYSNLNKHQKSTPAHKKWLDHCLHAVQQIFTLEEMAKSAPKENELEENTRVEAVSAAFHP